MSGEFVEVRNLPRALSKVDESRWAGALRAGLEEIGAVIVAKGQTDSGDRAPDRLAGSFRYAIEGTGMAAELHVTAGGPGARAVEFGRRPGAFPNVEDISGWLGEKGGNPADAFIAARGIAAKGTKGKHFFRHAIYRGNSGTQIARGLAGAVMRAVKTL